MQTAPPKPWERRQAVHQRQDAAPVDGAEGSLGSLVRGTELTAGSKDNAESGAVSGTSGVSVKGTPATSAAAVSSSGIDSGGGVYSSTGRIGYYDYSGNPVWSTGGSYGNYGGDGSGEFAGTRGYGRLGFATATPYASSYGYGRNGLSFSPYSSSAVYFPSAPSSSSSNSPAGLSHSFLQQTAEGLGRVSLLLDLNGCFLDRLCDHSGNLFVRLNSLSASSRHLLAFLTSHVSRQWTRGYLAVSAMRSRYSLLKSPSKGSDPPRAPILLPGFLAHSIAAACARLSNPTRQRFRRLLRRHNLIPVFPGKNGNNTNCQTVVAPESCAASCTKQLDLPRGKRSAPSCRAAGSGLLTAREFGHAELRKHGASSGGGNSQQRADGSMRHEAHEAVRELSPEEKVAVLWSELRATIVKIRVYCLTLLVLGLLGGHFKPAFFRFSAMAAALGLAAAVARQRLLQKNYRMQRT
ncbi:transmembrane protein [Cystoisospora suis]|uniref:Transmembrane protein n=1 Tax=Cystoisospora suis TaxID=483139 RepID=A0A2C6LBL6_9APIC|nr:transmembrane protein [Cystoisospora suis]